MIFAWLILNFWQILNLKFGEKLPVNFHKKCRYVFYGYEGSLESHWISREFPIDVNTQLLTPRQKNQVVYPLPCFDKKRHFYFSTKILEIPLKKINYTIISSYLAE